MAGTLYVVATPIGNLEDITVRALRILREVALIAAEDTRRTAHLLTRYGIATPTTSLHEHNEHRKSSGLIARLQNGDNVALVSDAGTPTVSDPGAQLIARAIGQGIKVEAIPGPNAALAALSVSGFVGDGFAFLGFPPTRSKDRISWMGRLRESYPTAVFYEAPHRIRRTLEEIQSRVGDIEVLVARELTKVHEELVRGPISSILGASFPERGEFAVVAKIGRMTENGVNGDSVAPTPALLMSELGHMTASAGLTRRQTIAALARKYGLTTRQAYQALEDAKKSGG